MIEKRYTYITPEDYIKAEQNGIHKSLVESRVRNGMDIDKAVTMPVKNTKKFPGAWGKWKDKAVVCRGTFISRIHEGWDHEKAATTPKLSQKEIKKKTRSYTDEQLAIAESNGLNQRNLSYRLNVLKWDMERAINTPKMTKSEAGKMRYKKARNAHV